MVQPREKWTGFNAEQVRSLAVVVEMRRAMRFIIGTPLTNTTPAPLGVRTPPVNPLYAQVFLFETPYGATAEPVALPGTKDRRI